MPGSMHCMQVVFNPAVTVSLTSTTMNSIDSKWLQMDRSSWVLYKEGCLKDNPAGSPWTTHPRLLKEEYGIWPRPVLATVEMKINYITQMWIHII